MGWLSTCLGNNRNEGGGRGDSAAVPNQRKLHMVFWDAGRQTSINRRKTKALGREGGKVGKIPVPWLLDHSDVKSPSRKERAVMRVSNKN